VSRLFRRFEQAEGARTSARYGGSGLGLAICQELTVAMSGRIEVDSEPGRGARVDVVLPLPAAAAPDAAPGRVSPRALASLRILLVEDDRTVADVMSGLLQAQGHHVVHVAHALDGLSEAAADVFDVALLDLDLPGLDGLALARQLRRQGFDVPLVAITARADADAEPEAMQAGFDCFLRKPLTGVMLSDALSNAVRAGP
jgi:CheY-like chemotaxis protein